MTMYSQWKLGNLADPNSYIDAIDIVDCDHCLLERQLRTMMRIRRAEEVIGYGIKTGEVICPTHLGIGQEAIATGISTYLTAEDRVFGAHRSHSHYLALGADLFALFAEILGKKAGCSRGMGGSMHLHATEHGLFGTVPIVAGTVPLAVGAALAAKKDNKGAIAVAYFGDGAAEEGPIHESLNLAATWNLPILFVCENNLFSSHLHISSRQPSDLVGRYANAHCIPMETVDGNDIVAVSRAAEALIARARSSDSPGFIEAVTYRWRGHVGYREDEDVGVNRNKDIHLWKKRDPVRRLADALLESGVLTRTDLLELEHQTNDEIDAAWEKAKKSPCPPSSSLLGFVYA